MYKNQNVKKLLVPASMKTIQDFEVESNGITYYSISGCSNLTEVEVKSGNDYLCSVDGVVYTKDMSTLHFYPMGKRDVSFTVPDNVTALDPVSCQSARFRSLDLKNVTVLGEKALESCDKLQEITIPAGLTNIPEGAIVGTSLLNIDVDGNNPTYADIDGVLFSKDEETLLQFPAGRTNTADNPYEVPSTTRVIGSGSFLRARISYVTIPENTVTTISERAFYGASLKEINIPEGVTSVGESAFRSCVSMTSASLPSTLKTLPNSCFRNCTRLSKIEFSEGLEEIQSSFCLANCAFTQITFPQSLKEVGELTFWANRQLKTVTIPAGSRLTTIGDRAFYECSALQTVTFGENCDLQTIGSNAFADLESLESINNIPASVTDIASGAFARTPNLATITFEEGSLLTTIGEGAFADCGIRSIEIPENVTTIQREAFRNCNALQEVNLSVAANSISPEAFKYCTNLKAINVPEENTTYSSIDGMLLSKDKETLVLFPAGKANREFTLLAPSIKKIGDYAFYYCENLENVTIPNKVTSIGKRAFGFCPNLNTVTFLCDEMIDPDQIAQTLGNASFDDGVTNNDGTDYRKNITLNVRTEKLGTYETTGFYKDNFREIKPSFMYEGAEYIAVSDNAVDLLSIPEVSDYTYILPVKAVDGNGKEYKVSLVGDYLFQNVTNDVQEVVVFDNVQYIGAKAFMTDIENNTSKVKNLFFIARPETPRDLVEILSTTRFKLNETGNDYSEIAGTTNIYVKKSAIDIYREVWGDRFGPISYEIKDTRIGTKYGTFSREFDVDLSDCTSSKVYAFTAGSYMKGKADYNPGEEETEYIVHMTSINLDSEGDGTYIPANSGVLLKVIGSESTDANFYYTIGEKAAYDNPPYSGSSIMTGVTVRDRQTVVSDGTLFVMSGGQWHNVRGGMSVTMPVHKAYMNIGGYTPGAKISFAFDDGETTSIEAVDADANQGGSIWNLQGQRVNKATKGIYISNGRKYIVK